MQILHTFTLILITHVILYYIGDDCIAIKGGTQFLNVSQVTCGPGTHGIRFVKNTHKKCRLYIQCQNLDLYYIVSCYQ